MFSTSFSNARRSRGSLAAEPDLRLRAQSRRLLPPGHRADLVERALLLGRLDEMGPTRLTVILGPAGYGKTTLLAQWWRRLKAQRVKVAWYTVSEADSEPNSFLRTLVMSLAVAGIGIADATRRVIFDAEPDVALDAILLELEKTDQPTVIILDDFDKVDRPSISRLVGKLAEDMAENFQLVLSGRRKPSLAFSRHRASGSARIVEPNELRLTDHELSCALGLAIDSPELRSIADATEGWPVAVQLYRFWHRRMGCTNAVPHFNGQAMEVADFLAEQVFAVLSRIQQEVLEDLSILEYIEPTLADHVRQASDSATHLHELAESLPGLMQQSYPEGEPAYRLHPLVADFARDKLKRSPGRVCQLHCNAAEWMWAHHRYAAAIHHAVRSGREGPLRAMVDSLPFFEVFLACGVGELRAILREIPDVFGKTLPRIQLAIALTHLKTGFIDEARMMLQRICEQIGTSCAPAPADTRLQLDILAMKLLFSTYVDGILAPLQTYIDKIRALAVDIPVMLAWCENALIVMHQGRGEIESARKSLTLAKEAYATGVAQYASTQMLVHELLLGLAQGELQETNEKCRVLLRRPSSELIAERCLSGMSRMCIAAIDYERSYRLSAADKVRVAIDEYGEGEAWFDLYAIAFPVIVDATYRRHGLVAANQHLVALQERLQLRGMRCVNGLLRCLQVLYHLRGGEVATAARLAGDYGIECAAGRAVGAVPWRQRDIALKTAVTLALGHCDYDKAQAIASHMIEEGRIGERCGTHIKGLVLSALVHEGRGDSEGADSALTAAIRLAYPQRYVAQFAEEGMALVPLLKRAFARERSSPEGHHVAAICSAIEGADRANILTDREAEIVAHLADGASNKMIARKLGLTDNTIKFHLKKIYVKLGVAGRKAAASRSARASQKTDRSCETR
jgi:LuxR family transcriptional regulator, maltose regulon positive regulatory protein